MESEAHKIHNESLLLFARFTDGTFPNKKLVRVLLSPQKSLDMPIERFLASLHFEQRGKLDQLGIEIGSLD